MIIYIEYVLIDNFIIDYYLLQSAFALTGVKVKRGRLFLSACFGAVVALFLPFITENNFILVPLKCLVGVLMVVIAHKFSSAKGVYIHFVIFFLYTAIVGGTIIAIFNLFNLDYNKEIFSALMLLPVCLTIKVLSTTIGALYHKKEQISQTTNVILYKNNVKISARGFFDTGNGAYHKGVPVIFCSKNIAKHFIDVKCSLKSFWIDVETINGSGRKFAFNLDKIEIYYGKKMNIFNNVTLCVIDSGMDGLYDVILHPALMEGKNEITHLKTKKIY